MNRIRYFRQGKRARISPLSCLAAATGRRLSLLLVGSPPSFSLAQRRLWVSHSRVGVGHDLPSSLTPCSVGAVRGPCEIVKRDAVAPVGARSFYWAASTTDCAHHLDMSNANDSLIFPFPKARIWRKVTGPGSLVCLVEMCARHFQLLSS